jgi:hypothetical protein
MSLQAKAFRSSLPIFPLTTCLKLLMREKQIVFCFLTPLRPMIVFGSKTAALT